EEGHHHVPEQKAREREPHLHRGGPECSAARHPAFSLPPPHDRAGRRRRQHSSTASTKRRGPRGAPRTTGRGLQRPPIAARFPALPTTARGTCGTVAEWLKAQVC